VREITEGRKRAAIAALNKKPDRNYWETVIREIGRSSLLRGRKKTPGHEHWRASFDWFLRSKDKTENFIRVAEGEFRDHVTDEEDE
jgi:hypothetical protein